MERLSLDLMWTKAATVGETERPKTMPKNPVTFHRVMKCQALLERENDPSGSKTMKKESFDVAIWKC